LAHTTGDAAITAIIALPVRLSTCDEDETAVVALGARPKVRRREIGTIEPNRLTGAARL
jgi:hypothetical protein